MSHVVDIQAAADRQALGGRGLSKPSQAKLMGDSPASWPLKRDAKRPGTNEQVHRTQREDVRRRRRHEWVGACFGFHGDDSGVQVTWPARCDERHDDDDDKKRSWQQT